jgi:PKD repeat protein
MSMSRAVHGLDSCIGIAALLLVALATVPAADVITTIAGGNVGDGGPALAAPMAPSGIVVDAQGNTYVADQLNHRVRRIDPNGTITTIVGTGFGGHTGDGGPAVLAQTISPTTLALDPFGNLFIGDLADGSIRKVDTHGVITSVVSGGLAPVALAVDVQDTVYFIMQSSANQVWSVTAGGVYTRVAGDAGGSGYYGGDGGPATSAGLYIPQSLSLDAAGGLLIADTGNGRIRRVDANGIITTVAGGGASIADGVSATAADLYWPWSAVADAQGRVYITDDWRVRVVGTNGIISTVAGSSAPTGFYAGDGGSATAASLIEPEALALTAAGRPVFVDGVTVHTVSGGGILSTIAGNGSYFLYGLGGPAIASGVGYVNGVVGDSAGNLFLLAQADGRLLKIDSAGTITSIAGGGGTAPTTPMPATAATLSLPNGLATDGHGILYISVNGMVLRLDSGTGTIAPFAGGGASTADGVAATAAQVANPAGLTVDGTGAVYIQDNGSYRVRKVAGGIITTVAGNGSAGFSGDGGSATAASIGGGTGLGWDNQGGLVISDGDHRCVRKVVGGIITTIAGSPTNPAAPLGDGSSATAAALYLPGNVAYDFHDVLYIGDVTGDRVRTVDWASGWISTRAGTGVGGFSGDGGDPTLARLAAPGAVGFDAAHNPVIGDAINLRVRRIAPASAAVAPVIANGGSATILAGNAYAFQIAASNYPTTYGASGLPTGLTVNTSSGVISGIPTSVGTYNVALSAGNSAGTATGALTLTVQPAVPVVATPSAVTINIGAPYASQISATGTVTGFGATGLPPGLSVSATSGAITGTPTVAGSYAAILSAGNVSGTGMALAMITVVVPPAPVISAIGQITIPLNHSFTWQIVASNSPISYTATGLPPGMTLNAATGTVSGAPTANGTYAVTVTATNGGGTGSATVSILVNQSVPVITTIAGGNLGDGGPALAAPMAPAATAMDAQGNIYFADTRHCRVRKIDTAGNVTTVAGIGYAVYGGSGDGGPALTAAVTPTAVAVDGSGNLFIADSAENAIRRVDLHGVITLWAAGGYGYGQYNLAGVQSLRFSPYGNLLACNTYSNQIYDVTTPYATLYAGNWTTGPQPTIAGITSPRAIAFDGTGKVYILDGQVVKAVNIGVLSVVAGGGSSYNDGIPATQAYLYPYAIACDGQNHLLIAESYRIRKVDGNGYISTVAGNISGNTFTGEGGSATAATLVSVSGCITTPTGGMLLTDGDNLRNISPGGIITTVGGNGTVGLYGIGGPAANAGISFPTQVASDGVNTYVVAGPDNRVLKIDGNGIVTVFAGGNPGFNPPSSTPIPATSATLFNPFGVAADGHGNVFVSAAFGAVYRIDAAGMMSIYAGGGSGSFTEGGSATAGSISGTGLTLDGSGALYVGDFNGGRVRRVAGGLITTVAGNGTNGYGGDGGPATSASMAAPYDAAVDGQGRVFIADTYNARIRMVANGTITTFAGGLSNFPYPGTDDVVPATAQHLWFPTAVAVDQGGVVYLADGESDRIQAVDATGNIHTVAGSGNIAYGAFSGDGGDPLQAQMNEPEGIAFDGQGRMLIADSNNGRIRMIAYAGVPATAPAITSPLTASVTANDAFIYQITATPQANAYAATGMPTGLWLSATSGTLAGVPTVPGAYAVHLTATGAAGAGSATLNLQVRVPPPVITSTLAATAQVGTAFSYQVTATNTPTSYAATGLPTGLAISATSGAITGSPTIAIGTVNVSLLATNGTGTGTAVLALTVVPPTPVITSATSATVTVGQALSYTITATNAPTSYAASGLPSGLSLNPNNGTISGGPSVVGTYPVTISATNAGGTGSATWTLTVLPHAPVISSTLSATATTTVPFSYTITASNTPTSYNATNLPPGLALSTASIIGTPTTPGTSTVTISATNAGGTGSATLTLTVLLHAPVITSATAASAAANVPFNYQITALNGPTAYSASNLPVGLAVSATSGAITGVPTAATSAAVTIRATNAGGTGSATLNLTVTGAPTITSSATAAGYVGVPLSYQITGSNAPTSFSASGLPAGLAVSATTGAISGTPTAQGTTAATVSAVNLSGTGSATVTFVIGPPAPVITSGGSVFGKVGSAFTYQTVATNSPTAYAAANLPPGLAISATSGAITGKPTVAATYAVTLTASNAAGPGTRTLSITVLPLAPVMAGASTANATVGSAFSYQITASNAPASFGASGLPSGLVVDTGTGLITGSPAAAGTYAVTISATNASGTASKTLTITAVNPPPPAISSATTASATVAVPFTYQIVASNNPTGYSADGLPAGLSLDATTGAITGTPTSATTAIVTLGAGNAGGSGGATLALTVYGPPVIAAATANGNVGLAFSWQIAPVAVPASTSYGASGLPAGLSVNATSGAITGTPTTQGTYNATVSATNTLGLGSAALTIVIGPPVPAITSARTLTGKVGVAVSFQVVATNGATAYAAANLPPGLSISATSGAITGKPTAAATYVATLYATNSAGTGTNTLTITVLPLAPVISGTLTAAATVGVPFSYQIAAAYAPASYGASGLPTGLAVNTATGLISGTPTAPGTAAVTITAVNVSGTASKTLTITVVNPPTVQITSSATAAGPAGSPFTYQITGSNSPTSFGASGLPTGLSVNATSGAITGTPTVQGTTTATITATNASGTGSAPLTITIGPPPPVITSIKTATGKVGIALTYQIVATNGATAYGATNLPPGLSVSATSGAITGKPTAAGTFPVTLAATNAVGPSTAILTITVLPLAPTLSGPFTASGSVGSPFSYQITASSNPTTYTATGLPPGLAVDPAAGLISGTPTAAGTYAVTISATNASGTASKTLTITITTPGGPG